MHSTPDTLPIPATAPPAATPAPTSSPPFTSISYPAKGEISRNGVPGSTNASILSRTRSLPRPLCLADATAPPPFSTGLTTERRKLFFNYQGYRCKHTTTFSEFPTRTVTCVLILCHLYVRFVETDHATAEFSHRDRCARSPAVQCIYRTQTDTISRSNERGSPEDSASLSFWTRRSIASRFSLIAASGVSVNAPSRTGADWKLLAAPLPNWRRTFSSDIAAALAMATRGSEDIPLLYLVLRQRSQHQRPGRRTGI